MAELEPGEAAKPNSSTLPVPTETSSDAGGRDEGVDPVEKEGKGVAPVKEEERMNPVKKEGEEVDLEDKEGEGMAVNRMEVDETVKQGSPKDTEPPAVDEGKPSEAEIKYWSAVKEKPSDFSSWTSLLQLVDQKGKLDPAREVFDAFLGLYPYCYGYWKKYADFERKHSSNDTAREVFERGVEAVPLSVDLWMHYLGFTTAVQWEEPEGKETIRSLYHRAVEACGMEYRSSKLWDSYLEWEKANGSPQHLMEIYDRLLATPTLQYQQYFESFKQLVEDTPPSDLLSAEEKDELWGTVVAEKPEAPEEGVVERAVREKILERRSAVHERCKAEVEKRTQFEEGIKRPYFHVKPLERAQLRNWREYLDFEIAEGNQQRTLILFERCMIACALYEDFWTKFAKYAEDHCPDLVPSIYSRACAIHLQQKPNIHVQWATYEEKRGNIEKARGILKGIDSLLPGLVLIRLRQIGLEVRDRKYEAAEVLYQESIANAESTEARNFYSWRYARFAAKLLGDNGKAMRVVKEAIEQDPLNPTLYLRLLDIATSGCPPDEEEVEAVFALVRGSDLTEDVKQSFALRRAQFLEEFGPSITKLLEAQEECQKLKRLAANARKRVASEVDSEPSKKTKTETTTSNATPSSLPQDQQQQQAQQWAAYQQQQQWAGYNYGQGYAGYPQYYQYPYQQQTQ